MSQQPARPQLSYEAGATLLGLEPTAPHGHIVFCTSESFGASVKGVQREENQDRFVTATFGRWAHVGSSNITPAEGNAVLNAGQGQVMMVADGMGGHKHGSLASQVVLDSLLMHLVNRSNWAAQPAHSADQVLQDLKHAMDHAQQRLAWIARRNQLGGTRVGTTALVGVIAWPLLLLAHAGDCRCYLQREGQIQCLTKDHTVGQEGRDLGRSAEETRRFDPILTSAISNIAATPRVDLEKVVLREGDVIVMCSNGVWGNVDEHALARTMDGNCTAQEICEAILAAAGSAPEDDATVVATKIVRAA